MTMKLVGLGLIMLMCYIMVSFVYNNYFVKKEVERRHPDCEIQDMRQHRGGWSLLSGSDIGWFYREYTLYDKEHNITFTEHYRHNIVFPFYRRYQWDTMPTREDKILYQKCLEKYESDMQNIMLEHNIQSFPVDINASDSGSSFTYLWVMQTDCYDDLDSALSKMTEYVREQNKQDDYSYITFYVLICNNEAIYERIEQNKYSLLGDLWDGSYIASLSNADVTIISAMAYDGLGYDKVFFEYPGDPSCSEYQPADNYDDIVFEYKSGSNAYSQPKQLKLYGLKY